MEAIKSNTSYNKSTFEIKDLGSEFYTDSRSTRYNYSQDKSYYCIRPNLIDKKLFQLTYNNPVSFNKNFFDKIYNSKTYRNDDFFSINKNNNKNKYISVKNFITARKYYPSYLKNRILNEIKNNNSNMTSGTETIDLKNLNRNLGKYKIKKKIKIGNKNANLYQKRYMSTERNNELSSTDKNLSYYYPNLFNISHNKIKNINSLMKNEFNISHFLFKRINDSNYNKEIRQFQVTIKPKSETKNNDNSNGKKKEENKLFTEKVYNFDILKNIRLNFKNSIERAKYKDFIRTFNTTRNIEINKV